MKSILTGYHKGIFKNLLNLLLWREIKGGGKTKIWFLEIPNTLTQVAIALRLIIITIAMPSASFADVGYYKTLVTDYFKFLRYSCNHGVAVLIKPDIP